MLNTAFRFGQLLTTELFALIVAVTDILSGQRRHRYAPPDGAFRFPWKNAIWAKEVIIAAWRGLKTHTVTGARGYSVREPSQASDAETSNSKERIVMGTEMRRSHLALVLSMFAMVSSVVTLYFIFLRSVDVELVVSPYAYISNTQGGLPDISIRFAILASGASTKAVSIQSPYISVTKLDSNDREVSGTEFTLSIPESEIDKSGFPIILQGGSGYSGDELFVHIEPLDERLRQYTEWFGKFSTALPDWEDKVEELSEFVRNSLIPFPEYEGPENMDVDSAIKELLREISDIPLGEVRNEHLSDVLYFRPGKYKLEFVVEGVNGHSLATHESTISISDVLGETLMERFNENTLATTSRANK